MNVENVDRIMHANTSMIRAYSQDSLIWGEEILIPKYTVRFTVTIPSNVRGSISIYINGRLYRRQNNHFTVVLYLGDEIKVAYSLRDTRYKFFSNTPNIEKGVVIEKDCNIWVGFNKLNEEIA